MAKANLLTTNFFRCHNGCSTSAFRKRYFRGVKGVSNIEKREKLDKTDKIEKVNFELFYVNWGQPFLT